MVTRQLQPQPSTAAPPPSVEDLFAAEVRAHLRGGPMMVGTLGQLIPKAARPAGGFQDALERVPGVRFVKEANSSSHLSVRLEY